MKTDLYEHKMQIGSYASADSNSQKKTKAKDACPKVQKKNQSLQPFFPR